MKKIMLVFGTRPEAIKMAQVVKEFEKYPESFKTIVCVTGQHREMLDQVLSLFNIKPDIDLNIMKAGQDLYDVTSRVLLGMRNALINIKPDYVLVHGDTVTSTAAALAAYYQRIPVGHVEAGLRTRDIYSPWPEEMNRQLTGRIATWHFAPTELNRQNLINENINENAIIVTGNTVIDALLDVVNKIESDNSLASQLQKILINEGYDTSRLISGKRLVLITGHRRENFGEGFENICHAIRFLAVKYPEVDFVYPVHMNPNVQQVVQHILGDAKAGKNIFLISPIEYLPFIYLLKNSYLVLSDSGGIQEEAPGLGKPVLVMREVTERQEGIETGTVILVGTDKDKIIESVSRLMDDEGVYKKMSVTRNPYGDGQASKRIVDFFIKL